MESNKINEMFKKCVNEAMLSASQITGTDMYYKKAQVYSSIANALALTGQIKVDNSEEAKEVTQEITQPKGSEDVMRDPNVDSSIGVIDQEKIKENNKIVTEEVKQKAEDTQEQQTKTNSREALKSKPVVIEKTEEVQEVKTSLEDVEDTNEWTDIMLEKHEESLNSVKDYTEKLGDNLINGFVELYSGGIYNNLEEGIKPMNIKGFVAYLDSMKEYIDSFVSIKEEYGEDVLNDCLAAATDNTSNDYRDVTADMFVDFVKYVVDCLEEFKKSQQSNN